MLRVSPETHIEKLDEILNLYVTVEISKKVKNTVFDIAKIKRKR